MNETVALLGLIVFIFDFFRRWVYRKRLLVVTMRAFCRLKDCNLKFEGVAMIAFRRVLARLQHARLNESCHKQLFLFLFENNVR